MLVECFLFDCNQTQHPVWLLFSNQSGSSHTYWGSDTSHSQAYIFEFTSNHQDRHVASVTPGGWLSSFKGFLSQGASGHSVTWSPENKLVPLCVAFKTHDVHLLQLKHYLDEFPNKSIWIKLLRTNLQKETVSEKRLNQRSAAFSTKKSHLVQFFTSHKSSRSHQVPLLEKQTIIYLFLKCIFTIFTTIKL